MKYLIWYNSKTEAYHHGTEMDLNVNESLLGVLMDVLYEIEESELHLVRKIVAQLNNARQERAVTFKVA